MTQTRLLLVVAVSSALALAACGANDDGSASSDPIASCPETAALTDLLDREVRQETPEADGLPGLRCKYAAGENSTVFLGVATIAAVEGMIDGIDPALIESGAFTPPGTSQEEVASALANIEQGCDPTGTACPEDMVAHAALVDESSYYDFYATFGPDGTMGLEVLNAYTQSSTHQCTANAILDESRRTSDEYISTAESLVQFLQDICGAKQ